MSGKGQKLLNKLLTYNESVVYWKQYQKFFPTQMQINESNLPIEEWVNLSNVHVHVDRFPVLNSKFKIIFIHGAGGNGRLLAPYAEMLRKNAYEVIAPDLPPYGLSYTNSVKSLDYQLWINILTDLIQWELKRTENQLFY